MPVLKKLWTVLPVLLTLGLIGLYYHYIGKIAFLEEAVVQLEIQLENCEKKPGG